MAKIVIKKRIGLEFLGEEYKDGYVVFKSISNAEADDLRDRALKQKEKGNQSSKFIVKELKSRFIEGKFPGENGLEDISPEDMQDFDIESSITFFQILTGQKADPKV